MSDWTSKRPSDAHPACPSCGSDVFVDALSFEAEQYFCNACSEGFDAVDSPEVTS